MMRRNRMMLGLCFVLCFAMGLAVDRFSSRYFGVTAISLIRSPLAYWRVQQRGWGSFETLQYTQDRGGAYFHRYIETAILPLNVNGTRLSDSYPVPKMGGAIAVVGTTVIILDRLGGLYRYDLTTGFFGMLPGIPRLPNNLDAYLVQRPGPPVNLADAPNDDLRARDIIFLQDRKELAAAYDKFDKPLGKLRTVVSVIPFDSTTFAATGTWRDIFSSDAFLSADISQGAGRLAYSGDGKLYLTIGDHEIITQRYPMIRTQVLERSSK